MITMTAQLAGNAALKQVEAVRKAWATALSAEGRDINREYDKTTATWKHDVSFKTKVHLGQNKWYVEVWAKNRIYWFVHESVSVMRGVLSPDWSPKTQPRVLGSGAGSGRLLYASKQVSKPPYEARKFTDEIIKVRQPKFQKAMEEATRKGAKAAP